MLLVVTGAGCSAKWGSLVVRPEGVSLAWLWGLGLPDYVVVAVSVKYKYKFIQILLFKVGVSTVTNEKR